MKLGIVDLKIIEEVRIQTGASGCDYCIFHKNTITKLLDIISKLQGEQTEEDRKKIEEEERFNKLVEEFRDGKWTSWYGDEMSGTTTFIGKDGQYLTLSYDEVRALRERLVL